VLIKKPVDIRPSEITSKESYFNRRKFMQAAALAGGSIVAGDALPAIIPNEKRAKLEGIVPSEFSTDETPNSYDDVTTYNNYYEFGLRKDDPFRNSQEFKPRPWSIEVTGDAEVTGSFALEDFVNSQTLEERIYRLRCVEAWSMVIPWVGISLADVVKRFKPLSKAKYVVFETLLDRDQMPGQRSRSLRWPYVEGLTIAEATNPLPILAVGVFGEVLPNQNGAPLRLIVPWKYGFKSIKGIVRMHFTDKQPRTSWDLAASHEYGFYANVNPNVDHPRWSQARERRIGADQGGGFQSLFSASKQDTVMFNGYGEHVAHLYDGLDLKKNF
jgi:methionine sulfoxide reductase catalytic subunit